MINRLLMNPFWLLKQASLILIVSSLLGISGCSSLIEKDESQWTVKEFYDHAKEAFDNQQWETAIKYYEKLQSYFPYGKYAEQSYLELSYAYYKYDEPESAKRELDEFIRIYPKHRALPYAMYLKALSADSINKSWLDSWLTDPAFRDMASTQDAYEAYMALLNRFPNSKYAAASRKRLIILRNRMARHELEVARYYYNRKAYLAAANRAEHLIAHYPRSMVNFSALTLMHDSYVKLGMTTNAEDVQKVIDFNTAKIQKEDDARKQASKS